MNFKKTSAYYFILYCVLTQYAIEISKGTTYHIDHQYTKSQIDQYCYIHAEYGNL